MTTIIKDGVIQDSAYEVVQGDDVDLNALHQILPLKVCLANLEALRHRHDPGVWLNSDDEVESLVEVFSKGFGYPINECPVVALDFPAFNDGRAYSSANLLRRQYNYSGEIRAIGDVRYDQLEQMLRCGFNAFQMAEGQNVEYAAAGIKGFSENYQTTADRPEPLFRRR